MTDDPNIALVRRFFEVVVNGGDFGAVDTIMAPDYVMRAGSLGTYVGRETYKAFLTANAGGAFTDMRLEVVSVVADGELVFALFTNSGRNTGTFLGMPPTGKSAKWTGAVLFRIVNGQIAASDYVEDLIDMFGQLGIQKLPNA